jgi:hypothetical protein
VQEGQGEESALNLVVVRPKMMSEEHEEENQDESSLA